MRPVVDSEYSLDQANSALDALQRGEHFGKIAINLR
jgi:NADPH:quinone reductase-like Zn-dependent oxidoreductase